MELQKHKQAQAYAIIATCIIPSTFTVNLGVSLAPLALIYVYTYIQAHQQSYAGRMHKADCSMVAS